MENEDKDKIHKRVTDLSIEVARHGERIDRHRQDIDRMEAKTDERFRALTENIEKLCSQSRADNKSTSESLGALKSSVNKIIWTGGGMVIAITSLFAFWNSGGFDALVKLINMSAIK